MYSLHRQKKPIRLYGFTSTIGLSQLLPPVKLGNQLPKWWELLSPFSDVAKPNNKAAKLGLEKIPTARHCYSMQEVFKRGIGIPLWTDTHIVITAQGRVEAQGNNREVKCAGGIHLPEQFPGLLSKSAQHFKFVSPWSFVCEETAHFVWTHPFYHQPDAFRFHTMPGVVEYRNQHATNINIVLPRRDGERQEWDFQAGEMLVYIFPMFGERLELVVEEVSERELRRINVALSITSRPILFNKKFRVHPWIPRF